MWTLLRKYPLRVFLAALPLVITTTALIYQVAMWHLEGQERSFWTALGWAAETLTTTGYGADSRWQHPAMVLFVVCVQFSGVFLAYILIPLLLLPMLESRFAAKLPSRAPALVGHVVIFRYGAAVETLIGELLEASLAVVLIEADEAIARKMLEKKADEPRQMHGFYVIFGAGISSTLSTTNLAKARALIVNGNDEENATAVLVAQELGFAGDLIALAEEPSLNRALFLAGASVVYTPRLVLGTALASRSSHAVQPRVDGIHQLGRNLRVAEIRIDPDSFLSGKTLAEAKLGAITGATVLGQWVRGKLDAWPGPDTRLLPRGILVTIGVQEKLDDLAELATGRRHKRDGPILVAGNGIVGGKVAELLRAAGEPVKVIDVDAEKLGTDLVGDVTDASFLASLDLDRAHAMVLALDSDRATLFATLMVKAAAPDLPTIARVNRAGNVDRIHRAGADFALSISQVSAQILAQRLLRRDSRSFGTEIQLLRLPAENLLQHHLPPEDVRARTGCSVVALERGEEVITDFSPGLEFLAGDTVYLCGHRQAVERLSSYTQEK